MLTRDGIVAIDAGTTPASARAAVAELRRISTLPITHVILTHAHWDHVQAADALRAEHGAPVMAHPAERDVWAHELDHLDRHGQWDWALDAARAPGVGPAPVPGWDGVVDATVRDGDVLAVGALAVRALRQWQERGW